MRSGTLILVLVVAGGYCLRSAPVARADDLSEFTSAHTRIVWIQDQGPANNDILATGQRLRLMGFDSEDGKRERVILGELRNYSKPLMAPDGQRVIFSDQQTQKFHIVNWDGTRKRLLGEGLAVDVWRDPTDAADWVYFAKRVGKPEDVTYRDLRRVKLDDPKSVQKIWDQTKVGCDNFQLSADGTRAAGEFPWPNGGIVDLATRTWRKLDEGCWASIAPDNSGVSWVFDGPHRHLQFHRPDRPASWKVTVNSAPGIQGAEVFHPRWSNHARYFAMTGPYSVKGVVNMISGGGPQVEVHLGRFSQDFQTVEAWHQVTNNARGDFYPDAWIAGGETSAVTLPGLTNPAPVVESATWPAVTGGLLFAWDNSSQVNQLPGLAGKPTRQCEIALQGRAVPGRFHDLRFSGGAGTLQDLDEPLLKSIRQHGDCTIEFLVTPSSVKSTRAVFCQLGNDPQTQLRLLQDRDRLLWEAGKSRGQVDSPVWSLNGSEHMAVVLSSRQLTIYMNGRAVHSAPLESNFSQWKSSNITLGGKDWRGSLEAICVYDRALSPAEIGLQATRTRARLPSRKPIPTHSVEAVCRDRSSIPDPQTILPYRRALAIHEIEIQKVRLDPPDQAVSEDLKNGAKILVAQWVILDGKILPDSAGPKVGETVNITIEAADQHPELQSERQLQDIEALDLPLYYDVTVPP